LALLAVAPVIAPVALITTEPDAMNIEPVKLLPPVIVRSAEPFLLKLPAPVIGPLRVEAPDAVVSIVPLPIRLIVRALVNAVVAVRRVPSLKFSAPLLFPRAASPAVTLRIPPPLIVVPPVYRLA